MSGFGDFAEKTGAVRNLAAEIFGDGLAHVRKGRADTKAPATRRSRRIRDDRDIFARMVRRRIYRIGIATVVGGDDQQIGRAQYSEERPEQRVEFLERFCEP